MKITMQAAGFAPPRDETEIETVVVYDDFQQPILVVHRVERGRILVVKAGEEGFQETLRTLGITSSTRIVGADHVS